MALDTFNGLVDAVVRWSKRKDHNADSIQDFVTLAEEEMYNNVESPLRIRAMDKRFTAIVNTTEREYPLPPLFLQSRRFKVNAQTTDNPGPSRDCDIKYRSPDQLLLDVDVGMPRFYSVTSQLEFDRIPDQAYQVEMQHWAKLSPLSSDVQVNAILTDFPSLYLYGTLAQLWDFHGEDQKSERYMAKMMSNIRGINKAEKRARIGNAPQVRQERRGP